MPENTNAQRLTLKQAIAAMRNMRKDLDGIVGDCDAVMEVIGRSGLAQERASLNLWAARTNAVTTRVLLGELLELLGESNTSTAYDKAGEERERLAPGRRQNTGQA